MIGLTATPKDEIDKKVREAAKILDLDQLLERKPKALSGGQRQRVAMGRAIVRSPKVFLMDEPLSNLDAKLRVQMRTEIAALHKKLKATIIYVTHDQTEAMTLGTRIVVLKDGDIKQVDSPQKLYNQPDNLFVAGFIGSPQMNFINATCKANGSDVTLNFDKFSIALPPAKAKKLIDGGYNGKTVVMGIRPEDIHTENAFLDTFPNAKVEATVTVSELLGAESQLYSKLGETEFVSKVDARDYVKPGTKMIMGFDLNKAHFFDPTTKINLNR